MKVSDRLYYTWLEHVSRSVHKDTPVDEAIKNADIVVAAIAERFDWVNSTAEVDKVEK